MSSRSVQRKRTGKSVALDSFFYVHLGKLSCNPAVKNSLLSSPLILVLAMKVVRITGVRVNIKGWCSELDDGVDIGSEWERESKMILQCNRKRDGNEGVWYTTINFVYFLFRKGLLWVKTDPRIQGFSKASCCHVNIWLPRLSKMERERGSKLQLSCLRNTFGHFCLQSIG